ncbi:MAG: DnaJ domain-containing protein [Limnothrix sp.]
MAATPNYYQMLEISARATQQEVKAAYRRLAKRFHPDICEKEVDQERIVLINQAYEVLGDRQQRQQYDLSRNAASFRGIRSAQGVTVKPRHSTETDLDLWLQKIYRPLHQVIDSILEPLAEQLDELSADPFDDELMGDFENYLEVCLANLEQAQKLFQSLPNPANVARAAQDLYYCLNHLGDGLEQFKWFTLNYSEDYLHSGQEMFRRADQFSWEAQQAIAQLH